MAALNEWFEPNRDTDDPIDRLGDCIYDFRRGTTPRQRPGVHEQVDVLRDLGGKNALIARKFYYYGKDAIALPPRLADIVHQGRAHKSDANYPYVRTVDSDAQARGARKAGQGNRVGTCWSRRRLQAACQRATPPEGMLTDQLSGCSSPARAPSAAPALSRAPSRFLSVSLCASLARWEAAGSCRRMVWAMSQMSCHA